MPASQPLWLMLRGFQFGETYHEAEIQEITDIRRRLYDDCTMAAHVYTADELVERSSDMNEYLQNLGDA